MVENGELIMESLVLRVEPSAILCQHCSCTDAIFIQYCTAKHVANSLLISKQHCLSLSLQAMGPIAHPLEPCQCLLLQGQRLNTVYSERCKVTSKLKPSSLARDRMNLEDTVLASIYTLDPAGGQCRRSMQEVSY